MKKLTRLYVVFIVLISFFGCKDSKQSKLCENSPYSARYHEVYNYIQDNWDEYLSDGRQDTIFPKLPNPGLSYVKDFLTQFYWDSYFNNEGLLLEEKNHYIARYHVENLLFEADTLGFVPNMNSVWGMSRSQPPYLSMMVRNYYEQSGMNDKKWLKDAYDAVKKEYAFWMDLNDDPIENHLVDGIPSLIRYYHHGDTLDLLAIYDHMVVRLDYPADAPLSEKLEKAVPFIVEAGTGMDFTPRFERRCSDFFAVDLNSNMYMYEKNFAWMVQELGLSDEPDWEALAALRKEMINKYLWSDERGLFLDYDFVNNRHSKVAAATTFSPLFAGIASLDQAKRVASNLNLFEHDFGLSVVDMNTPEELNYMWGNDDLWAPMQYLAIAGLRNYNLNDDAQRIACKWMNLITKNYIQPVNEIWVSNQNDTVFRVPGKTYEKYSLKDGGSINDDEYPSLEILCWSSAVFAYSYHFLTDSK